MVFHSDDSKLINSDPIISSLPLVPPDNYLWRDPRGRAYPGWHHQLVLHLLAVDSTWLRKPGFDFTIVKMWLSQHFPSSHTHEYAVKAIAEEYLDLDEGLKAAYRGIDPC